MQRILNVADLRSNHMDDIHARVVRAKLGTSFLSCFVVKSIHADATSSQSRCNVSQYILTEPRCCFFLLAHTAITDACQTPGCNPQLPRHRIGAEVLTNFSREFSAGLFQSQPEDDVRKQKMRTMVKISKRLMYHSQDGIFILQSWNQS
jgi:hypothetical protein